MPSASASSASPARARVAEPKTQPPASRRRSSHARPALRPELARELVDAQRKYDRAKIRLEETKAERDKVLARAIEKVELGKWYTVAGWAIRITKQRSGDRFQLAAFLEKHKLTASMKPFVSEGGESPRLWLKPG